MLKHNSKVKRVFNRLCKEDIVNPVAIQGGLRVHYFTTSSDNNNNNQSNDSDKNSESKE